MKKRTGSDDGVKRANGEGDTMRDGTSNRTMATKNATITGDHS